MTVYHLQHVSVKEYRPQAISVTSLIFLGCIDELSCSVHRFLNVLLNLAILYEYIFAYIS